jgi:protein-S-isoprenylcysteine O-methyltransferase Ste14
MVEIETMSERILFDTLLITWFALAGIVAVALFFVDAPYGRHARKGWGPTIENRIGWMVMEAPAPLGFAACFVASEHGRTPTGWAFLALWEAHYLHRALVYPLRLHRSRARMPIAIAGMAFVFNSVSGYLNGRYLFGFSGGYPTDWLTDLRFVAGLALFVAGYVINRHADRTLRRLRQPGETSYGIPRGGLYRWVSCPNYLGEAVEWTGWAIATWSIPGLAFAVWVVANLAPRARAHHRWYRQRFANYPPERRALLPGLW